MATRKSKTQNEETLTKELKSLSKEIQRLKYLEFVKVLKRPKRLLFFSFLHGLMVGFGSVIGATLGVAIFIYILTQISFVPIIGDFVDTILKQINIEKTSAPDTSQSGLYKNISEMLPKKGDYNFTTPVSAVVPEANPSSSEESDIQ